MNNSHSEMGNASLVEIYYEQALFLSNIGHTEQVLIIRIIGKIHIGSY